MEKIYKLKHIIEDRINDLKNNYLQLETDFAFRYSDVKDINIYLDECIAINFKLSKLYNYLKIVDDYVSECNISDENCIKLNYLLEYFRLKEE